MSNLLSSLKIITNDYIVAKDDTTKIVKKFIPQEAVKKLSESNNKIKMEREILHKKDAEEQAALEKQTKIITNIITNDPAAPKNLDNQQMAKWIIDAAKEFNVDPLVIISIAQQETHFTQNVPTANGSGIMQLTGITIKDMYLRSNVYDKALLPYLKKYKNPEQLKAAMRKDPELNIKLGTALYKQKLKQAKGDEKRAFMNYNGSNIKQKYSKDVYARVLNARQQSGFVSEA